MADPVSDIIGDYRAFAAQQRDRLLDRGIDISPYSLSHVAVRVPEWDQYVHLRNRLERYPVYILFEDFTHVKFYRLSLRASVEMDTGQFKDGFHHVDGWVPQRLVTATGPNPLPR